MTRRVLTAEVTRGRVQGRPILGWMDGMKVAMGNRGMTVDAARQCAKDRKEWKDLAAGIHVTESVSSGHFCVALCSFRPPSRVLVGYHLERGGMPLLDAVLINCYKSATTENGQVK